MGLGGALPKENPADPRKRSIDPQVGWVDLPTERVGPLPYLRPPEWGGEWSDQARDMWKRLWSSGQATQWDPKNPDAITRYVELHEQARMMGGWNGPILTAVAQIEEKFGLTPYSMRRMFWRFKPADDSEATMHHLAPVRAHNRQELR